MNAPRIGIGINVFGKRGDGSILALDLLNTNTAPLGTYTRATGGYTFTSGGVLVANTANQPRPDYDPATLAKRGWLMDGSRTNKATYSQTPSDASWLNSNITVASGQTTGIDGAASGWKLTATTTAGGTALSKTWTNNSTSACYSAIVKKGTGATTAQRFLLRNNTTATDLCVVLLNYDTGAVSLASGAGSYGSIDMGGGWWLVWISSATGITSGDTMRGYVGWTAGAATAGDHIYFYHFQGEENATFPSSVIPTTTGTASRSADLWTISNAQFLAACGQNIPQAEGTIFAEFAFSGAASNIGGDRFVVAVGDALATDEVTIHNVGSAVGGRTRDGGSTQGAQQFGTGEAVGSICKVAHSWKAGGAGATDGFQTGFNGSVGTRDTTGAVPATDRILLGCRSDGSAFGFVWLRRVIIYPFAMTDAQLQGVTA